MAKWKRRKSRSVPAGLNRYYSATGAMIRPAEGGHDGATVASDIGSGGGCGQPVAPSAELASCAPVVVEATDAQKGEEVGTG